MNALRVRNLEEHDASDLVGLRVKVLNAAQEITDESDEVSTMIPDIETLSASAAVVRCLLNVKLQGSELRAIRRIAGWTATDLAGKMGDKTSPETISRWENEKQPMGGYAEKVFRLVVCEELASKAPGVVYRAGAIANLTVIDPWRGDPSFEVPPLVFDRVKIKSDGPRLVDAWEDIPIAA
jgi:DNA-binding transcriptional regulator YiaG